MSFILNLYKGKGDALNKGNYRGLKLTEHVMKVMERIVDGMIREMIAIDEMQLAFVPGRGTTDAIFIIRQLQEEFLSRKDLNDKKRRTVNRSLPRLTGAFLRAWLRLRHGAFWGCAPAPLTKLDLIDWLIDGRKNPSDLGFKIGDRKRALYRRMQESPVMNVVASSFTYMTRSLIQSEISPGIWNFGKVCLSKCTVILWETKLWKATFIAHQNITITIPP